jgi:hypothetical protein
LVPQVVVLMKIWQMPPHRHGAWLSAGGWLANGGQNLDYLVNQHPQKVRKMKRCIWIFWIIWGIILYGWFISIRPLRCSSVHSLGNCVSINYTLPVQCKQSFKQSCYVTYIHVMNRTSRKLRGNTAIYCLWILDTLNVLVLIVRLF